MYQTNLLQMCLAAYHIYGAINIFTNSFKVKKITKLVTYFKEEFETVCYTRMTSLGQVFRLLVANFSLVQQQTANLTNTFTSLSSFR